MNNREKISLALQYVEQLAKLSRVLDCIDKSYLEDIETTLLREQNKEYNYE